MLFYIILSTLLVALHSQDVFEFAAENATPLLGLEAAEETPIAILHGMGDSCFNPGMKRFSESVSAALNGVLAKCIPLGDTQIDDTVAAFSLVMNEQVDEFARRVQADEDFAGGFKVVGLSQGALIARGYVQRYSWRSDFPSAKSLLSIHGPLMGVGKLPLCSPTDGTIGSFCNLLNTITGEAAYRPPIQNNLAQSNYYRHPCYLPDYLETSYLPPLNFETETVFPEVGEVQGLDSLEELILIKADNEDVIFPAESSWFGLYTDNACGFDEVTDMLDADYFKNDSFGLKSLYNSNRMHFERTAGGHIQITSTELTNVLQKYWSKRSQNICSVYYDEIFV